MKTCSNCGHELNDEMDFCPMCGTSTNGEVVNTESEASEYEYEAPWYHTDIFNAVLVPIVRSFDNGKFFLYTAKTIIDIIVTTFLLSQPYQAYYLFKEKGLQGLSSADKTVELIFAIVWLIIAIFSFGYWMKRIKDLDKMYNPNDKFVVIPLGTNLFQWLGEWLALMLTVGGIFAIIVSLADVHTSSFVLSLITSYGWYGGIIAIIVSIIIVFAFRLIAEKVRALAAIANNTSKQYEEVSKSTEDEETNDMYFNLLYAVCILATVGFMLAAMFSK